jgi:urea carboxylase system permease
VSQAIEPADEHDLARFGYAQSLGRSLGGFSSFAAGFAYISILTGLFQMFPLGYRAAGPAFFWTWPVVAAGQFCVALCFAELATHYPLCGSVYQWAKGVGGPGIGWMGGLVSLAGSVVSLAAVSMALQAALPVVWPRFQVIGDPSNPVDSARNAVILGALLIAFTTFLNVRGVALLARINNVGVAAELIGAVLLVILFFAFAGHGPGVVTQVARSNQSATPVGFGAFLAAALTASYVLYGFETAGSLAEETVSPRTRSPRAILLAIGSASVVGALLILSGLMAARDPLDAALGSPDGGLARIATDSLGPWVGRAFLLIVAIAIASCALTVQTAAVRLVYAMARDGLFPASRALSRVGASKTPIWPPILVGVVAALLLLINLNHPKVVEAVAAVSIVWINGAYLFVTVPLLFARLRGWPPPIKGEGRLFRLGRFGTAINVAAVIWGIAIVTNTAWPRPDVYGEALPGRFFAPIGTLALLLTGVLYYNVVVGRPGVGRREGGS